MMGIRQGRWASLALQQSLTEPVIDLGDALDLVDRGLHVVRQSVEFHDALTGRVGVEDCVARLDDAVARLPDRAGIQDDLGSRHDLVPGALEFGWGIELV
ncbi:MAG: hypothetical protein ACK56F_03775, partial [bacterium]